MKITTTEPVTARERALRRAALEAERAARPGVIESKRAAGTLRSPSANRKRRRHGRR
jgi:hypothetical protein